MKRVLFVGDINVDIIMGGMESMPIPDREITCRAFDTVMGSSAVICASAYAALGGHAAMLGLAGTDELGEFMMRGMQTQGIDTHLIQRTSETKTGVTVNLIHGRTRTQITYPGTITEFDGSNIGRSTLRGFDHVHFAGPYLQTRFRPHIHRLLGLAQEMNISASLDPQWDATEQWQGLESWLPLLTWFFPNADEAISICHAANAREACAALARRTRQPLVKAGREGSFVWNNSRVMAMPMIDVPVVDTTGAGDSFDAGFLYAILEKSMSLRKAVQFATATAARSCMFAGGVSARSSYSDVIQILEKYA